MAEEQIEQSSKHEFCAPKRVVKTPEDLKDWPKTQAYAEFVGFIQILNQAVQGKKVSDDVPASPIIAKLVDLLETLSRWVDEIPPIDQPQRFGNKAFKEWSQKLRDNAKVLITGILPDELKEAVIELEIYLCRNSVLEDVALDTSAFDCIPEILGLEGFGNMTRIDYGTGHEAKFVAFLCCLMKIGVILREDAAAVVLVVMNKYLDLVRKLQTVYRMEPAGSQGVWGLDDFQFLPFIWGSAQLIDHPKLDPKSFVDPDIAEAYSRDYLFMSCIKYINSVKTGPFAEHSNTLWGISGVPEWSKVNSGLIKMYKAEVLGKFPVIQHFPFGTILSFEQAEK